MPWFPSRGNHDSLSDVQYMVERILPAGGKRVQRREGEGLNYHVDWNNVRLIVLDPYSELGDMGVVNAKGADWVEGRITSAGAFDHVFLVVHEPFFPRFRHLDDSANADLKARDAFWSMLVRHSGKMRAVFTGHTHFHYRMRIKDPARDDGKTFPDEEGGVYQVDCGEAGRQTRQNTFVLVQIEGKNVAFRSVQAAGPDQPFKVIDQWEHRSKERSTVPRWSFAALADNRNAFTAFKRALEEIRDTTVNPEPRFAPVEFVASAGDLDPIQKNHKDIYQAVFPPAK